MKKIVLAGAIAMTAFVSQAYNVAWGAKNIYIPVADNVAISQTGIVPESGNKFAADALTISLYWVGSEKNQLIGNFATTGSGVVSATKTILGEGVTSDIYTQMVADHGTTWKPEYYFTATYATKDGVYNFAGTATAGTAIGNLSSMDVSVTADFKTAGSWTYTANSVEPPTVPEPTSGLLLLLGAAGMALKRRRV